MHSLCFIITHMTTAIVAIKVLALLVLGKYGGSAAAAGVHQ